MRMTEQEAKDTMRGCGWSFLLRTRKSKYRYVYAARTVKQVREERYIGSLAALANLTIEDLKRKLSCI